MTTATHAQVDWLPHIDFVVDHPVAKVWPFLVDWDSWMSDKVCEHVSGPANAAGETKRVITLKDGEEVSQFLAEVVRFEPERRLVYRLMPLPDGSSGLDGIDRAQGHLIFALHAVPGSRTLVTYDSVGELESSTLSQQEMTDQFSELEGGAAQHWLDDYVPELERLLTQATGPRAA